MDALGGDRAPQETVAGAAMAAERFADIQVLLAGPADAVERELSRLRPCPDNIETLPASQAIGMQESPVQALRGKRDSSITVGIAKVVSGGADAFVSAGNTGAVVAASSLGLGLIEGVQRPGIAVPILVVDHPIVVIDVGANIHCKPGHLVQYGIMATVFARDIMHLENPRVGLLNVGEEARKGTYLLKEGFDLLSRANLNFVGNVEPKDAYNGLCDIVVCEGVAGNVLLKTSEAVVGKFFTYLKSEISKKWTRRLGYALCRDVFQAVKQSTDYSEYGGAPLLGVNGVTIIGHGRSDAKAVCSAVREARSFLQLKVNEKIAAAIKASLPLGSGAAAAAM